ncbi:MAG: response regulator [Gemmatimonadota bacterium]|nr:response regulator [Gemmatimonadota bacterium]
MHKEKILIVEDEPDILEVMKYNLTREGYRISIATNGVDAVKNALRDAPDLILLDLMLPGLDGIEVCRRLKGDPVTKSSAIIMVTAKGEESDIVLGLGVGADDYVTKPFSPKELVARVKAVLRRGPSKDTLSVEKRIVHDELVVDMNRHEVLVHGNSVEMTPTELRLLFVLASNPGRVFTRSQLLSRVIGESAYVVDRNIDVHVSGVRNKLGDLQNLLQTIRGVGYRFKDHV